MFLTGHVLKEKHKARELAKEKAEADAEAAAERQRQAAAKVKYVKGQKVECRYMGMDRY
jgi:hypothetical protein